MCYAFLVRVDEQAEAACQGIERHKNLRFADVVTLVKAFGFRLSRVKGSHHIFVHSKVRELVNLQDVGGKAKPYQVQQLLEIVERYSLQLNADEES